VLYGERQPVFNGSKKCLLKGSKNKKQSKTVGGINESWNLELLERILHPKTWRMIGSTGSSEYFNTGKCHNLTKWSNGFLRLFAWKMSTVFSTPSFH